MHLRRPVRMNGTVETNFCLPGTNLALQARGEVAWMDRKGNAGIRFLEISEPMKRDLQLWLEQQYFQTVQDQLAACRQPSVRWFSIPGARSWPEAERLEWPSPGTCPNEIVACPLLRSPSHRGRRAGLDTRLE